MDSLGSGPHTSGETDRWLGQTLADKYEIVEFVARGGMGRVYRAVQQPLGRDVAVKILSPSTGDKRLKEEFRERFFREAATCARLQHPNTVTLFDYGHIKDGTVYMVMEFVHGRTLKQLLRDSRHLDAGRALRVAHEIALSLREAHRIGVVHRDLKPSNVIVGTDRDGLETAKVLDFGLVKLLDPETSSAQLNADVRDVIGRMDLSAVRKGVVVGSPGYMSPEQIEQGEVDRRSDIYALGVILFECLTGEPPFRGVNGIETLMLHVTQPAPKVSERNPRLVVPDEVEKIVATCLQKDKNRRYQRVDDLLSAIRHAMPPNLAVELDALSITPPTPPPRRMTPPRSLAGPATAGVLALMLAAWLMWPTTPATVPDTPLAPMTATIVSQPAPAEVWEGTTLLGLTPYDITTDRDRQIEVRAAGHLSLPLDLEAGQTNNENVRLSPAPAAPEPTDPATPQAAPAPSAAPTPPKEPIFTER